MSTRGWLCVYAGATCAAASLLVLYALQPQPVPWYRWLITSLVGGWFAGLTRGMFLRMQVQRALRDLLQQEHPHA